MPDLFLEAARVKEPTESAQAAGLRYVTDSNPGITRERAGKGFAYRYATGDVVQDEEVLKRIKSLVIPPAWTDVWICPDPCGHVQATGRDQRGRKQHRYHPKWRETRDETKFARMIAFGKALPTIRLQLERDMALPRLSRRKVLATVVRLLEVSLIRVGNDEYARENESFGLTTLRNTHVSVRGDRAKFRFRGKSGKWHEVDVRDKGLARVIKKCQDLPGQELFEYYDDEGQRQDVKSTDVNEYLREITGQDFTAKDFRTWAGTVLAAVALRESKVLETKTEIKKNLVRAVESVAQKLGNTPAVCRKCYIHPEVIGAYLDGTLLETVKQRARTELEQSLRKLPPEEAAVLALLHRRLTEEPTIRWELKPGDPRASKLRKAQRSLKKR
jgi:DNA topoisomerase-1